MRNYISEAYGVEKQLKMSFGQSVSIANGGYLIIEHTEALHVIDVRVIGLYFSFLERSLFQPLDIGATTAFYHSSEILI